MRYFLPDEAGVEFSPPSWRQHCGVSVSVKTGGGLRRRIGSRSGHVAPGTPIRRARLDAFRPPRTTSRRHRDVLFCASLLRPSEPRFRSLQNAQKLPATAPPFAFQPFDLQRAMGDAAAPDHGANSHFLPVLRESSVASPPCTTSAARRNIPFCPRGNDKEGSR
jgi:hypothetical protein